MNVIARPGSRPRLRLALKPLAEQTIVITGASSGIGLATARLAAAGGARLVLVARSGGALDRLVTEITAGGGEAISVVADVADEAQVQSVAVAALRRFGGFDTWVNDAGVGLYGRLTGADIADMRRLFDTNFWGVVYGSRVATQYLRQRGGALINLGSEVSDRAVPLQGIYSASKHAIKGFTEALRMELADERAPISVSLVKPGQIDTPFTTNAKNMLDSEPHHVPPVYAPEVVARAILHCAVTPRKEVYAGGGARVMATLGHLAPTLADRVMEAFVIPGTPSGRPLRRARGASGLDRATEALEARGNYEGHVMASSLYTEATLRPAMAGAALLGALVALLASRRAWSHRSLASGGVGRTSHLRLEAQPASGSAVPHGIRGAAGHEADARPWLGAWLGRLALEILGVLSDQRSRQAHPGWDGESLMHGYGAASAGPAQSDEPPARSGKPDVLAGKRA